MKKENKTWRVFITEKRQYEDDCKYTRLHYKPIYRNGKSEKQVIARLRRTYNLYDHDENNGSCSVSYMFDIEDAKPNGVITYTVFDFEW